MTQQSNQADFLLWWNELSFPGKELFDLKESGELILSSFGGINDRLIATIKRENASAVFKSLNDKFSELETRINELTAEWDTTEDKTKLSAKIDRLKDSILHVNAVGALDALLKQVTDWEKGIKDLSEKIYNSKLAIIEQAEKLVESDNWKEATQSYRDLVEQWKQIGHASKSKNDPLWNRLEEARNKFFDRKRHNQEEQERELMQNLDLKMEMVEKAEALADSKSWKDTTEAFRVLMEQWKATGRTIHERNEELWKQFITAKNKFFDRKKEHFDTIQKEQEENLNIKSSIVEKAESLKESTDWTTTTQAYAELMEEWKKTGRVSAEKGDELWGRFNAAKDQFFNAKRAHFEAIHSALDENLEKKREFLKRAERLKNSTQWREATIELNELMSEWKKTGAVPREHSDKIWEAFIAARKHFFDRKDAHFEDRRKQAEKQIQGRTEQARNFLTKLEDEIKEEEEKLADFRNGLENITPAIKIRIEF